MTDFTDRRAPSRWWLRQAISDENMQADMAYVSIAGLILVMVGSVVFLCTMSAVSYARCTQIVDVGQGVRSAIPCPYDPNPLGIAIAACLGAFGSPIGALALYMGQTRRRENAGASKVTRIEQYDATPLAPIVATTEAPMPVKIMDKVPVRTQETPPKRTTKAKGKAK